ncbi:MAG: hypothetical protein E5Y74_29315 [Mesorhizobium sp.]|uniref:hypothetical protein n=1 Tax=Mesorhizobium sp. TaxID=1871066 RepID=UPI001201FA6C|nr:hypothetical protein [Mesorhizobium sp.]TIM17449.1 MAG: hypothetical protein E5Y74_29315 [Mesorhizobium sp.]
MFEIGGRLGDNSSVRAHVSPTPMLGRLLAGWNGGYFSRRLGHAVERRKVQEIARLVPIVGETLKSMAAC